MCSKIKKVEKQMARKIGPEAKIISLFTALPEDSKRIVADVIKSQTAVPRKVSTKKSSKKVTPLLPDSPSFGRGDDFEPGATA